MLDKLHFEIYGVLPSWNDYIALVGRNRFRCKEFERGWKDHIEAATWEAVPQGVLNNLPVRTPASLTIKVWRPNLIRRDIHNLFVKPAIDAMIEVGILEDDNEFLNPEIRILYMGVDLLGPHLSFEFETIEVSDE